MDSIDSEITPQPGRKSPSPRKSKGAETESESAPSAPAGQAGKSRKQTAAAEEGLAARLIRVATEAFTPSPEPDDGPDPVKILTADHEKVRALFKEYEKAGDRAFVQKKKVVEQISRELDIHAQIEEKIFYQAFRSVSEKEPKQLVRESFEEHKIVKTLLAELSRMEPSDEQYDAKVTVLKESVEHHADEEEDQLFPDAEKLFDDERLLELGAQMQAMKDRLAG